MSVAFIFPGQGSQYVGMALALADAFPEANAALAEADEALGRPLRKLLAEGPEADLRLTWNTQPAILAASVACYRALRAATSVAPAAAAGHSLGEYSALVAAGALAYPDALRVVERRGRFMQEAVPLGTGTMVAVLGLDAPVVARLCEGVSRPGRVVEVANDNSPGQVVISGHGEAVEEASRLAREAGAKRALPLAVSAPFHCSLMVPAGERLAEVLGELRFADPGFPVVANAYGRPYAGAAAVLSGLVSQVSRPVRWQECVRVLGDLGVTRFVEVGPGKVLSGLVRRIVPGAEVANVEDPASLDAVAKLGW